jgi:hypothetical protein
VSIVKISEKTGFTTDGGLAILMINKTGGASVKGYMVQGSPTTDNGFSLCVVNVPNPIGIVYDAGVADGGECWVVISGMADVYYNGNVTRNTFARGFITGDAGYVSGQALSEAVPTAPFATDKHFYEIGHPVASRTGAGLCLTALHFN